MVQMKPAHLPVQITWLHTPVGNCDVTQRPCFPRGGGSSLFWVKAPQWNLHSEFSLCCWQRTSRRSKSHVLLRTGSSSIICASDRKYLKVPEKNTSLVYQFPSCAADQEEVTRPSTQQLMEMRDTEGTVRVHGPGGNDPVSTLALCSSHFWCQMSKC